MSPKSFRAAPRGGSIAARRKRTGSTVRYRDTEASTTTFTVLKSARGVRRGRKCVKPPRHGRAHGKRCSRLVSLGSFRHRDSAGANRFRFTGRVRRHKLRPGRYTLKAAPRFDGAGGRAATTRFRIVR